MASAAILNGGRSVRYGGVDKSALLVGGRSIRDRQLDVLATLSDDIMLVGGGRPVTTDARARWIPDRHPGQGPVAGIEAALTAARHALVIVLAGDMPGVTAACLQLLLAAAETPAGPCDVVVPRTAKGYHPLCAVYRRETCLPVASAHLAAGILAVRALFPRLRVREVTGTELAAAGDPARLLANVNTPAEHEALATNIAQQAHKP